ncbi:MAG TPA: serine hydrolase [Chloroflexota bacterium]|jgi:beta-lactamase class A
MTTEANAIVNELEASIAQVAHNLPGRLGVVVHFLEDDLEIRCNADERFLAASLIKVPIMAEVYRQAETGALRLDETIVLDAADVTGGAGVLQYLHPGLRLSITDAVELMISISDNTAANMVLRRIGTDSVNDAIPSLGLRNTVLGGLFGSARPAELRHRVSETSPDDVANLLRAIARSQCVSAGASASMLRHLEHVTHQDVLPRYLPLTPHPERLGYPIRAVQIAHKSGSLTGIRHDVGIITIETEGGKHQTIVSALTDRLEDNDLWTSENVGERTLADLGRLVFDAMMRMSR